MNREEAKAAAAKLDEMVDNQRAALATQREGLDTLLRQKTQIEHTLGRYRRGDDLREVLVEFVEQALVRLDDLITQQHDVVLQLELQARHLDEHVRMMHQSFEG